MSDVELTCDNNNNASGSADSASDTLNPLPTLSRYASHNAHHGMHRGMQDHPALRQRRLSVSSALSHHTSISSAASLASIDRPPSRTSSPEGKLPASKIYHPLSPHVLALLMPASIFGVLARLGIQALVGYDGRSIFPLAWVQVVGCVIMGVGVEIKDPLGQFYGPLYTALTTGFCGSLTTFSGWQLDVFQSWLNVDQGRRDWLRDVIDGLTKSLFTLALSLAAVMFGSHCASILRRRILPPIRVAPPRRIVRYSVSILGVLIYAAAYPAYFRLPAKFRHQATAALLFSFPGTLTRYLLSIYLNPALSLFPLGTFAANMFGTAMIGVFQVLQGLRNPLSPNACAVMQGLEDGYCGCLTTVSTFAVEVMTLEEEKNWFYVVLSWVTAQLLLLVILGPSYWAADVSERTTCIFVS
ncbi:unnamed protein product [Somion occarium]